MRKQRNYSEINRKKLLGMRIYKRNHSETSWKYKNCNFKILKKKFPFYETPRRGMSQKKRILILIQLSTQIKPRSRKLLNSKKNNEYELKNL